MSWYISKTSLIACTKDLRLVYPVGGQIFINIFSYTDLFKISQVLTSLQGKFELSGLSMSTTNPIKTVFFHYQFGFSPDTTTITILINDEYVFFHSFLSSYI